MDIEKKYVKYFYEKVADSWINIRQKFKILKILKRLKNLKNKKILEVGCGTATQLIEFKDNFLIGIDFSKNMIKHAKEYANKRNVKIYFILADARYLPFKENSFDFVFSIATIHHIKKRIERIKAIEEILRVSKDLCLFSVLKRYSSLTFFRLFIDFLKLHNFGDIFLTWNYKGKKLKRFYHTYSKKELISDLRILNIQNFEILEDKFNYYVIFKK